MPTGSIPSPSPVAKANGNTNPPKFSKHKGADNIVRAFFVAPEVENPGSNPSHEPSNPLVLDSRVPAVSPPELNPDQQNNI